MREFIIADNQDITKAGMMFLLSSQKDTALLLEADNKAELVQQLRLHPQAVVILDYTLFALMILRKISVAGPSGKAYVLSFCSGKAWAYKRSASASMNG